MRVHVADTLRDLLGIRGDTRAWTLRAALERVAQSGNGIVVILREPEDPQELAEALRASAVAPPGVPHSADADKHSRRKARARCCAPMASARRS